MDGSPRRISSASATSPEFEFWAVSDPPTQLLTADELFADGVLLPLHQLSLRPRPYADTDAPPGPKSKREPELEPDLSSLPPLVPSAKLTAAISCFPTTRSKRWKDIFPVGEKKPAEEKDRRKERKGGDGAAAAELNISIWPFSRSRSSGSDTRSRTSTSGRRVSSAPCSRSNSRGESTKHHHALVPPGGRGGQRVRGGQEASWRTGPVLFGRSGGPSTRRDVTPPPVVGRCMRSLAYGC